MKDLQLCQKIVDQGLGLGVDEIEVFYYKKKKIEVMIEKNDMQIPKGDNYEGIGIRVFKDGKKGFTATNLLDADSLNDSLRGALAIAEMSPKSPFNKLPEPKRVNTLTGLIDPNGFSLTIDKAVKTAGSLMDILLTDSRITIDSANLTGALSTRAIANSKGLKLREDLTNYNSMIFGFAKDGDNISSFDLEYTCDSVFEKLKIREFAEKLKEKLLKSLGAATIPSFKGHIVLSPLAVASIIIGPLTRAINGREVFNGTSPLKGKKGTQIANSLLTIIDDPTLAGGPASRSFDREGTPSQRLPIIRKGRLESFIYDHQTALKAGTCSTGHAVGTSQSISLNCSNIIIEPGKDDLQQIIKDIKRGIVVNRFSGNTDFTSGDFSGVVKGGYYIENGEIIKPIREVMIAGNLYEILHNLTHVSSKLNGFSNCFTPHLAFGGISITGK